MEGSSEGFMRIRKMRTCLEAVGKEPITRERLKISVKMGKTGQFVGGDRMEWDYLFA